MSRAEAILQSIANGTAYTDEPMSRFEELLLAIKNGVTVSEAPQSRIEEILAAIANGTIDEYLDGKNLFDISKFDVHKASSMPSISEVGDNYLSIVCPPNKYGHTPTMVMFKTVCKNCVAGKTYILTATSPSEHQYIYLDGANTTWLFGDSRVLTEEMLNSYVVLYGYNTEQEIESKICTISNVQIELGETATPYTPYAFESELEEALVATADKLKGE
jgi:hypothetical protein